MIVYLKEISPRIKEIWLSGFCVIRIFTNDEGYFEATSMTEHNTFSKYNDVVAWMTAKGLDVPLSLEDMNGLD